MACDHAPLPAVPTAAAAVQLDGCVADLGISLVAQLLASGVVEIRVAPCPERPEEVAARVASWGQAFDGVAPLGDTDNRRRRRSGQVFRLDSPSVARRSMLGLGLRKNPPFDLSESDVARVLAALTILRGQERVRLDDVDLAPADRVAVAIEAEGCTACGVCVRACPNEAFELVNAEGVSVLRHDVEACRSDRACVRLCPEQALTITAELSVLDLVDRPVAELARVATAACERCGVLHPVSDGALCPTCRFRRSNPFSSRLMTGSDSDE